MNPIKNLVSLCFVSFFIKLMFVGVQMQDAALMAIMSSLLGYLEYKIEKEELIKLKMENNRIQQAIDLNKKEIEELRSHVSTMKLGHQVRSVSTKI